MPPASDIILGLSRIATDAEDVSITWHVALVAMVIATAMGFRPEKRVAAVALSVPLGSVAFLALTFGNPFNGAVFALLAVGLAVLARHAPRGTVTLRLGWSAVLGCILLGFGAVYPHFVQRASWFTYLYAAPLGAIPCPTLSAVIGVALIAGGFDLGAWRVVLAAAGCFYALFGVLRLGVRIDVVLLCGVVGLLVQYGKDHVRQAKQKPGTVTQPAHAHGRLERTR